MSTFDQYSASYTQVVDHALSVTGGNRADYAVLRVAELKKTTLRSGLDKPVRILDFGCGDGSTSALLRDVFESEVVGVDVSKDSLRVAREKFGDPRTSFAGEEELPSLGRFDLIYCNGVFHHIPRPERVSALKKLAGALREGGCIGIFDNTPWNPGTRFVMSRIPFDADADLVNPWSLRKDMTAAGFEVVATRYLFLIPPFLKPIFFLDEWFRSLPAGAQYLVLARKSARLP